MTFNYISFVAVFINKLKVFINILQQNCGLTNLYSAEFQNVEKNYISILK
jgi:predicted nucleic-acid-binding Zn-ribbon protein